MKVDRFINFLHFCPVEITLTFVLAAASKKLKSHWPHTGAAPANRVKQFTGVAVFKNYWKHLLSFIFFRWSKMNYHSILLTCFLWLWCNEWQEELTKEREQLKQKMQEELEANLKDREQALKNQLSVQREALLSEKKQVICPWSGHNSLPLRPCKFASFQQIAVGHMLVQSCHWSRFNRDIYLDFSVQI